MKALDQIVPGNARLDAPLAGRTRRLGGRQVARAWTAAARVRDLRAAARRTRLLWEGLEASAARRLASSDRFLGWLAALQEQLRLISLATAARRGGGPASARWARVMEACEQAGLLGAAAPRGRLPADFPARVRRLATAEAIESLREGAALFLPYLPHAARRGRVTLSTRADPATGRPGGTIEFPEAGVRCKLPRRLARDGRGLRASLHGSAIRFGGISLPWPASDPALEAPDVGAPVRPTLRRVLVLARDEAFERRVELALEDLAIVWPEAERLVRTVTRRVVPLLEPGTVSFSSASVPGVSFINIRSAPRIRLAEDLLHEAVHERLHRIERVHPLVEPGAPRVYSPWRREGRPLRGLVHGACTFGAGETFFSRALAVSAGTRPGLRLSAARRLWLARRLIEESDALEEALRILTSAQRAGWLRPAGARLVRAVRSGWNALKPEAARCRGLLRRSPAGRRHLAALRRQRLRTGKRTLRWSAGWNASLP